MVNVAIIGCGEVGSRYFQSLKLLDRKCTIYVVDSKNEALKLARK